MDTIIKKALENLEQSDYSGYFDEMDQLEMPLHLSAVYHRRKKEFMDGLRTVDFIGQLQVLANALLTNKKTATTSSSSYDEFRTDIQLYQYNQEANTSLPLAGKTVDTLKQDTLDKMFAQKRVKEHFEVHQITPQDVSTQLKTLSLLSNGFVIKGTFLCLTSIDQIRSVSPYAHTSRFFSFEDNQGMRTSIVEVVQGNLVEQFQQMIRHIKRNLYLVRDVKTRTEDYQIPEQVFTELLANAFIHANYDPALRNNIKVQLFPDRLEIFNPGSFPKEVDLKHIESLKQSYITNAEIAQVFYLHDWIEVAGKGIKRSQEILRRSRLKAAEFEEGPGYVMVTVYKEKHTPVHEKMQTANQFLDNEDFAGFFEWVDVNGYTKDARFQALKHEFIRGRVDALFLQRLKVLAREIIQEQDGSKSGGSDE